MANDNKRMTKAAIIQELAEITALSKKQVAAVFEGLQGMIKRELGRRGPGEFVIPDMLKLTVKKVPERKNVLVRVPPRPGEEAKTEYRDYPATKKLRARPLKKLKDLVLQ